MIYTEYLKNWLCDTGLLVSRGSRCCICCFCLPPVGGSVSLVEGFLFFLDERLRNKTLLPTSKLSFWLGFWCSYLCRCVSAGGQVSVQWEHPWRHPHRDSRSAGGHKKYRELRHTGVVLKVDFINFIKDNNSGMGRCWLGGRLGGLGGVGPSARGNTIPGEGGGTEVPLPWFSIWQLFCWARLSYTQPFRHSVVDGDGVYTGGRRKQHFTEKRKTSLHE